MLLFKLLCNTVADAMVKTMSLSTDVKESYTKACVINHNLNVLEAKLKQKPSSQEFMDGTEEAKGNTAGTNNGTGSI